MGKPTGFLEYERKDALQIPPLGESKILKNLRCLCQERNSRSREPAVWNAAFPSARPA